MPDRPSSRRRIELEIDGRAVAVAAGTTVAAAAWNHGVRRFRTSVSGDPRAPLCAMGTCFECRVEIDGQPQVRSCMVACRPGMVVRTAGAAPESEPGSAPGSAPGTMPEPEPTPREAEQLRFEIVVVGGGPAGLAAAVSAAGPSPDRPGGPGPRVALVDDNPAAGGQIWRQGTNRPPRQARRWLRRARELGVAFLSPATVVDIRRSGPGQSLRLWLDTAEGARQVVARTVVLATGATERFLPFPGWTLPGVTGAGGLQALIKGGLALQDRRIVVAGSGPLLLAVAELARARGARVVGVYEQASATAVLRFARGLWNQPGKALRGLALGARLLGVPVRHGAWPLRAEGQNRLERVVLGSARGEERVECDWLACGFGLVPSVGLARYLGCAVARGRDGSPRVLVDPEQRTTVPGVFVAGESTGIGGVELALIEGRIAGHAAAGRTAEARRLFDARQRGRRFARQLEAAYGLRPQLRRLPDADTVVCRCEDVTWSRIRHVPDRRGAKLETRCGMGPCQGRVCGAAQDFLFEPRPDFASLDRVRPPFYPVTLETLAQLGAAEED